MAETFPGRGLGTLMGFAGGNTQKDRLQNWYLDAFSEKVGNL